MPGLAIASAIAAVSGVAFPIELASFKDYRDLPSKSGKTGARAIQRQAQKKRNRKKRK
jgi:hypothetical protein